MITRIFRKKKCDWCQGETRNVAHFENEKVNFTLQLQINDNQIQMAYNESFVGGMDANYCPVCGRRLVRK